MAHRVSVVIPTYNRAHLLGNAIESVLAQTYSDFELIIADDGSTDRTAALAQGYLDASHPFHDRIQYFRQEHHGKSVALNNALLKANGEWIAFLDSDDTWLPEKLERQFRALAQFPECGACFTDCQFVNSPVMNTTFFRSFGRRFDETVGKLTNSAKSILESPCASIITVVCRADLMRKIGGFDPNLHFTEDYDFLFRLAMVTEFCFVNALLALADRSSPIQRHSGTSAIWDKVDFRLRSEQYRYEKWLKMSEGLPSDIRKIITRRLRAVHSSWANWHLEHEDYEKAQQAIAAAATYQLTPNLVVKWALTRALPGLMRGIALKRSFDTEFF